MKRLKLEKETLIRLQEDQMKSLYGAAHHSTQSRFLCKKETIEDGKPKPKEDEKKLENSCCRRSCR